MVQKLWTSSYEGRMIKSEFESQQIRLITFSSKGVYYTLNAYNKLHFLFKKKGLIDNGSWYAFKTN